MVVKDRGVIFDATTRPPHERIAFFTSLCPLQSGAILSGFQVGSGKHSPDATLRICRSDDAGTTWREWSTNFESRLDGVAGSLAAPEALEIEPGRLLHFATWFDRSDPTRPLFDPVTEGILRSKLLRAVSTDQGRTWSPWEVIATPGLTGCASTGPIVRWPDGSIAYPFESFKEFDDPSPARHAAWIVVSRNGGRSFSKPLLVAQHPEHKIYYWDQRLCATRTNGEFIALFWTHDLEQKRDLRVHFRRGTIDKSSIHATPIRDTTIPGQIAAPLQLDDGRLLAFVVDRARPGTMRLWMSHDAGASWPESDCLLIHTHEERAALSQGLENIDFKRYWEDMGKWSFGHPAIRSLGNGRVLVAWYGGTPDAMSIHWARVALS
jgi:hypothetical protein